MPASAISLRENLASFSMQRSTSALAQPWKALRASMFAIALFAWVLLCALFSAPALHAQTQTAAHTSSTAPVSPKPNLIVPLTAVVEVAAAVPVTAAARIAPPPP